MSRRDGGDYHVDLYDPSDAAAVAELHTHILGRDLAANGAYREWKYDDNPYLQPPLIYLARHRGRVVGMRGMYGGRWEAEGETLVVPCGGDFVILPDHRNRGLFGKIMDTAMDDLARRGYPYAFSLSASPVTLLGSRRMGWQPIGSLGRVRRGRTTRPADSHRLRRLARRMTRRARRALGPAAPSPFTTLDRSDTGTSVRVSDCPLPQPMANLVDGLPQDGRIRHVRDQTFFAWRFANPLRSYRFLFAYGRELDGYLVLGTTPRGAVAIVDWEARDEHVRRRLLETALGAGAFPTISTWSLGLVPETRRLLRLLGFEDDRTSGVAETAPTILVRDTGHDGDRPWHLGGRVLTDASDWDPRMIYSDAY